MAYYKSDQLVWSFREGKAVVKDPQNDLFFPMDEVGTIIWDMIDGVNSINDIVSAITSEYDVSTDVAQKDTETFIKELFELGLIEEKVSASQNNC
jgi:hypothetical protein